MVAAVLKAVMREGATVEPELVPRLAAWIEGYDGDGEHARLRGLLARGSASREAPGSCEGSSKMCGNTSSRHRAVVDLVQA